MNPDELKGLFERYPQFKKEFLANPELAEEFLRIEQQTVTDDLTGAYNFRFFRDQLDVRLSEAERKGRTMALVVTDADDFGPVNKVYGKHVGDEVLKRIFRAIKDSVRWTDSVYRIGGDEGAVILPETGLETAEEIAVRIGANVNRMSLTEDLKNDLDCYAVKKKHSRDEKRRYGGLESVYKSLAEGPELVLSLSQGIGVFPDTIITKGGELYAQTDSAMRLAKRHGGDCIRTIYDLP